MNSVVLIGRLTKDPELSYTTSQTAYCKFTLAVDRPTRDKATDFIRITAWGKVAENCKQYLAKGRMCAVNGRIETGSYTNREGRKVETTEVVANNVEFIQQRERPSERTIPAETKVDVERLFPETTFNYVDDGAPF